MTCTDEEIAGTIHALFLQMQADRHQHRSLPWQDEDPETRAITIAGVASIRKSIYYGMAPEKIAEHHHHEWCAAKIAAGWTPGEFDRDRKTHPNLVHWRRLPERERYKCFVFIGAVAGLTMQEAG